MIFKGNDKITNYHDSEFLSKNAYGRGDAYNYIINGTYSTGFAILAALFTIVGVGFIIIGYLDAIKTLKLDNTGANTVSEEIKTEEVKDNSLNQ